MGSPLSPRESWRFCKTKKYHVVIYTGKQVTKSLGFKVRMLLREVTKGKTEMVNN